MMITGSGADGMQQHVETIFALATPPGRSAIQVIRVSGPGAARALRRMAGGLPEPRRATLATITDPDGNRLDRGMVMFFPGLNSATGEDLAEFHLHGSPVLGRMVMQALETLPRFRLADPGEFTRRSFLNGRIDLDQAEAIGDMIDADTAEQHRAAMSQLDGRLGTITESWREQLVNLSARLEALIDFADEELPDDLDQAVRQAVDQLIDAMRVAIAQAERNMLNRDGITVAILGRPNAGKSTLLNILAGDDRAIVSPEAGTTRDLVRVSLDIGGLAVHLIDTAGIRATTGMVEKEGIRRAIEAASTAAIVLVLIESTDPDPMLAWQSITAQLNALDANTDTNTDTRPQGQKVIPVISKADACPPGQVFPEWMMISAQSGQGMDSFDAMLAAALADFTPSGEAAMLTRERHRHAVTTAFDALERARDHSLATSPELMAEEFRHAALALGRITGRVDVEDLLDQIFSAFCIGK